VTFASQLIGEFYAFKAVKLGYPAPDHAADYEKILKSPVVFGAPQTEIEIFRERLDQPMHMACEETFEICARQCERLASSLSERASPADDIRRYLVMNPGEFPSLDEMAEKMSMSSRTLRRKLQESGYSYQKLLDEVRCELATEYLKETNLSQKEIAYLLGYKMVSSFNSAFRQWTGSPPSHFRRSQRLSS